MYKRKELIPDISSCNDPVCLICLDESIENIPLKIQAEVYGKMKDAEHNRKMEAQAEIKNIAAQLYKMQQRR